MLIAAIAFGIALISFLQKPLLAAEAKQKAKKMEEKP
jgi:hypothetical protein